jgi:hypothetical protein
MMTPKSQKKAEAPSAKPETPAKPAKPETSETSETQVDASPAESAALSAGVVDDDTTVVPTGMILLTEDLVALRSMPRTAEPIRTIRARKGRTVHESVIAGVEANNKIAEAECAVIHEKMMKPAREEAAAKAAAAKAAKDAS